MVFPEKGPGVTIFINGENAARKRKFLTRQSRTSERRDHGTSQG